MNPDKEHIILHFLNGIWVGVRYYECFDTDVEWCDKEQINWNAKQMKLMSYFANQ